jgi:formyl-CoA transferase
MQSALEGITVLDLSRVLAGPLCAMMLADLGAEVVKVEKPGEGDETREWGPPWAAGESAYYLSVNRNKRSITVDLKAVEGREIVRRLARKSDVIIENFKTGTLEKLGLGYEELSTLNPGLVFCSITGYGQTGPDRDQPGNPLSCILQGVCPWRVHRNPPQSARGCYMGCYTWPPTATKLNELRSLRSRTS